MMKTVVKPDSKVHLIQSAIPGPIEKINVSLDDKVEIGDILFLIDSTNTKNMYDLAFAEVETRTKKVEIGDLFTYYGKKSLRD